MAVATAMLVLPVLAQAQPIAMIGTESPPYLFEEGGKPKGLRVDLNAEIAKRSGLVFGELTAAPTARMLQAVENGQRICATTVPRTPAREDKYIWGGRVATFVASVFVLASDTKTYAKVADLGDGEVGAQRGGTILATLQKDGAKARDFANYEQMVKNLAAGRIVAFGSDYGSAISSSAAADVKIREAFRLTDIPMEIACTKDIGDEAGAKLLAAVKAIIADGTLKGLYAKYGIADVYDVVGPRG
jgi:ABC-type amino acid transport substrate-binding protein